MAKPRPDPAPSAQQQLESREQYAVVRAALNELPERQRRALLWMPDFVVARDK